MVGLSTLDRTVELGRNELIGLDVIASVGADGELYLVCNDEVTGATDHWVVVDKDHKDLVLLELLREYFRDSDSPSAECMTWLQQHDIRHEIGSAATEHRRLAGRTKPTPAGP
jgi:hypothetical protein